MDESIHYNFSIKELSHNHRLYYHFCSVMTAITQVPFILLVHFSMREGFSPYALVYGISLVQLLVLSVYNIVKG